MCVRRRPSALQTSYFSARSQRCRSLVLSASGCRRRLRSSSASLALASPGHRQARGSACTRSCCPKPASAALARAPRAQAQPLAITWRAAQISKGARSIQAHLFSSSVCGHSHGSGQLQDCNRIGMVAVGCRLRAARTLGAEPNRAENMPNLRPRGLRLVGPGIHKVSCSLQDPDSSRLIFLQRPDRCFALQPRP